MIEPIQLYEHEDWAGQLARDDISFLLAEHPRINIRQDPLVSGQYILNPNEMVGVISLPSGRQLECYPKVPVSTLFYMLAVAYRFPVPWRDQAVHFEKIAEVLEHVAMYFATLIEERINLGLYRQYVECEDNLAVVRGRIDFSNSLRRNFMLSHRHYCRYEEFTWDIPENQIVRQTARMLAGWDFRPRARLRLARIDGSLDDVAPTTLPMDVFERFHYHRLNNDYMHLHSLCRLFLEGASLVERSGVFAFRSFLLDMNKLFEEFVAALLSERTHGDVTVSRHTPVCLGRENKLRMFPDVTIKRGGEAIAVLDCKYKRLGRDEFENQDYYQALAYCTALDLKRGLLVYPRHVAGSDEEIIVRNSDVSIRQLAIDLGGSREEFDRACDALTDNIFAWVKATEPEGCRVS